MRPWRRIIAGSAVAALALAGCGGGDRQDKNEKAGTYTVDIVDASFPAKQTLAEKSKLRLAVRNTGSEALPDVAVTVDSFTRESQQAGLADPTRPVWIVDHPPVGGDTAYVNTWALGRLNPGQTKTFEWDVTAVVPGTHTVKYRVAAGLDGKAKAQLAGGAAPEGAFTVDVSGKPAEATVDPKTGKVVRHGAD
jgi:hypothetical protein